MTSYLLDTYAFLWWMMDRQKLSSAARTEIGSARTVVMVSSIVPWEIAIKVSQGRLKSPTDFEGAYAANRFIDLPVSVEHAQTLLSLPDIHKDPFDRMLVAQARVERLTIITSDAIIARYDVPVLAA